VAVTVRLDDGERRVAVKIIEARERWGGVVLDKYIIRGVLQWMSRSAVFLRESRALSCQPAS
jgi:hypothetical protein